MTNLASILDRLQLMLEQSAGPELLSRAVPVAIILLVAGVGLSVLGAKLAKFAVTGLFFVVGLLAGRYIAGQVSIPTPLCAIVAGLLVATIGHLTYRLWAGVVSAGVLAMIVVGLFGYQRIIPQMEAFDEQEQVVAWSPTGGPAAFPLPTTQEREAYRQRTSRDWFDSFWGFAVERDANLARHGQALAAVALLVGLFSGVVAMRGAMILSTSLIGTAMVTTGLATLVTRTWPDSLAAIQDNQSMMGMAVGAFLVASLVVQTLITRRPPQSPEDAEAQPVSGR